MDSLPAELLGLILLWDVRMCKCDKNTILPLRSVCKAFDAALRPYVFKTVQLEFSRFLRSLRKPEVQYLIPSGGLVEAFYLDMMVVRDEEEILRLSDVFQSLVTTVPEMGPLLASLRRYCMNETTFDETDFRGMLESVVQHTPNLNRLKVNLPFQVVGQLSTTATLLLTTTFSTLAKRPEEHKHLETLVLDHVSDTTVNAICNNPIDLLNAMKAFAGLKNLVLSVKRQESGNTRQTLFAKHLWFLIRKAVNLESLCLIGWNVKRDIRTRRHQHSVSFGDWMMRSLPYTVEGAPQLKNLRFLELKRVDIDPRSLIQLVTESAETLKEVFLNEVYIKVFGATDRANTSLWIGHPNIERPDECCWLAEELRNVKGLKLDVLRATCLGYDDFEPDRESSYPNYDLKDPTGRARSFDERFVDAVFGLEDTPMPDLSLPTPPPESQLLPYLSLSPSHTAAGTRPITPSQELPPAKKRKRSEYDAETYQREINNPTSQYKRCIDGYFFNHNEQALKELQNIIKVADRGMNIISDEIDRARQFRVDETIGGLVDEGNGDGNGADP